MTLLLLEILKSYDMQILHRDCPEYIRLFSNVEKELLTGDEKAGE